MQRLLSFLNIQKAHLENFCPGATRSLILQLCGSERITDMQNKASSTAGRRDELASRNQTAPDLRPDSNLRTFCFPSPIIQSLPLNITQQTEKSNGARSISDESLVMTFFTIYVPCPTTTAPENKKLVFKRLN